MPKKKITHKIHYYQTHQHFVSDSGNFEEDCLEEQYDISDIVGDENSPSAKKESSQEKQTWTPRLIGKAKVYYHHEEKTDVDTEASCFCCCPCFGKNN